MLGRMGLNYCSRNPAFSPNLSYKGLVRRRAETVGPKTKVSVGSFAGLLQLIPGSTGSLFLKGFTKGAVPTAVSSRWEPIRGMNRAAITHGGALYG